MKRKKRGRRPRSIRIRNRKWRGRRGDEEGGGAKRIKNDYNIRRKAEEEKEGECREHGGKWRMSKRKVARKCIEYCAMERSLV